MHFIYIAHQLGHEEYQQALVDTTQQERRDPYKPPSRWMRGLTPYCLWMSALWR